MTIEFGHSFAWIYNNLFPLLNALEQLIINYASNGLHLRCHKLLDLCYCSLLSTLQEQTFFCWWSFAYVKPYYGSHREYKSFFTVYCLHRTFRLFSTYGQKSPDFIQQNVHCNLQGVKRNSVHKACFSTLILGQECWK